MINTAIAESYPNSCPAEARSVLSAVGGCSAVDKNQYSTVYEKCCALPASATPTPSVTSLVVFAIFLILLLIGFYKKKFLFPKLNHFLKNAGDHKTDL